MSVDAILARPPATAQAHDLALSTGRAMRRDKTFAPIRDWDDVLAVEVGPVQRARVIHLLEVSPQAWRRYVRQWEAAGLAHRCADLKQGRVYLFPEPENACPVCGKAFTTRTPERSPYEREAFTTRTRIVLNTGDASRDEEGDAFLDRSEVAALAALERAGVSVGESLSDEEVRALGYEPTARGWVPRKETIGAA